MYNRVILIGNLGSDTETKQIGESLCAKLRLATSRSFKNKNGEWQDKTSWHTIICWRNRAEQAAKYNKGDKILVEGEIEYRQYENKDGNTVYVTEINAYALRKVSGRDTGSNGGGQYQQSAPAPTPAAPRPEDSFEPPGAPSGPAAPTEVIDDLPF